MTFKPVDIVGLFEPQISGLDTGTCDGSLRLRMAPRNGYGMLWLWRKNIKLENQRTGENWDCFVTFGIQSSQKSYDYVFEYLSNLSMYFFEKNTAGVTFCGPGGSESHTLCSHRSVSCCCLVGPKLLPNQLLLDLIGRKPGKSTPKNWENGGFSSHV